jgi:hypothetical protein
MVDRQLDLLTRTRDVVARSKALTPAFGGPEG